MIYINSNSKINPLKLQRNTKTKYTHLLNQHIIDSSTQVEKIISVIPLNIFQTWNTLQLPPNMKKNVELLKSQNPEFTYYLYDDIMCRTFIQQNFDADVLYAFDKLKPGAYKADLWRYCILYKKGGIYLDIKYKCVNHFKLIELTNKEYCVRDRHAYGIRGIYNALLCFKPNNTMLDKCIKTIVHYVKQNILGHTLLYIGPHLMCIFFTKKEVHDLEMHFNGNDILLYNKPILSIYDTYRIEQSTTAVCKHYSQLWFEKDVFNYPLLKPINSALHNDQPELFPYIIHNWFPLQFKKLDSDLIEVKPTPIFFKDTQMIYTGYMVNNESWFVLHKLYTNKHFFAIFDTTMNLLRYSELFHLETNKKTGNLIVSNVISIYSEGTIDEYSMETIQPLKWYTD
jgi:hypothetical protein